ncbi:MAG: ChaB family protein [Pseudomonadota bacterium]|nr:ChaB family protein [Pseudomonadota bacterium]
MQEYGEVARAHRTAFAALKHCFEKQGDRRVPKESRGPSGPRGRRGGRKAREGETFDGANFYGSTKDELYEPSLPTIKASVILTMTRPCCYVPR